MDTITKQAIIWALVIVLGGGVLSLALGQGFWGEKGQQAVITFQGGDMPMPRMGPQCSEDLAACKECHKDKF